MTLKQFVEAHPLPTLVAVAVAAASTAAGVVTFTLGSKYESDKSKIEVEYKSDLSSLKARLASIERKLGSDDKTYFDVSQLVITPDRIKSLDQSYKSGGDGLFFYTSPIGEPWKYELTSEADLASLKMGAGDIDESLTKLLAAMAQKNVHLWRRDQTYALSPKARKGFEAAAPKTLKFFPMVAVQTMSEAQLKQVMGGLKSFFDDESDLKKISNSLDRLLKDLKTTLPASSGASAAGNALPAASQSGAASAPLANDSKASTAADKQLELEGFLGTLFRGDMAAVVLGGIVAQTLQIPQLFEGAEGSLTSVQKKGNVLYIQMSLKFTNAQVAGFDKPVTLTVDREIFIVTNSKTLYIVQVEVPTLDGRSEAYPWVGQWLSSIRIPI
ncbi:MAG: hypothetical protein KAX47_02650 [Zoogloea sp.]|jgi:hypothetical protein|nr:hypothetical protein [Zoogloea sp.]